jgi:O-antigen/teichoic acid export membrane protein
LTAGDPTGDSDRPGDSDRLKPPAPPPLWRAALSTLGTRAALLPLAFAQGALLARGLGPEGLGGYSAALVDMTLLVTAASLGLPGGLAVLCSEAHAHSPSAATVAARLRALRRLALGHGLRALAVVGLGALLVRGLGGSLYARLVTARAEPVLLLIFAGAAAQYLRDTHNALLWGGQQFSTQNRLNLGLTVGQLVATAALWATGRLTPTAALGLHASSQLALALAYALGLRDRLAPQPAAPAPETPWLSVEQRRRLWQVSLRNFLHILPDWLLFRIDIYLIQELVSAAQRQRDLGLYQAGVRIAELLLLVPSTLNTVLFAKAAAREDVGKSALASAKLGLLLGLAACAGMALLGRPLIVLLFGARYGGSFAPCLLVLLGCTALCFSGPLAGTLSGAAGYPRSVVFAQCMALLVNVGANLILLPRLGILGAAAASALAYATSAALIARAFARRFDVPLAELLRPISPLALLASLRRA